jgi:RNA polymerase sigma-70 factor (ECF subfamily)
MNRWCAAYRPAIVGYLRKRGYEAADAEDLAQEVFEVIHEREFLKRAERGRGRFRHLLIALTKRVEANDRLRRRTQKRGGGKEVISLEAMQESGEGKLAEVLAAHEDDEMFDRAWVHALIDRALTELREQSVRQKKPYFRVLQVWRQTEGTYAEVGEVLGLSGSEVANVVVQARKLLSTGIRRLISEYVSSDEEYSEERRYLSRFLERGTDGR